MIFRKFSDPEILSYLILMFMPQLFPFKQLFCTLTENTKIIFPFAMRKKVISHLSNQFLLNSQSTHYYYSLLHVYTKAFYLFCIVYATFVQINKDY